MQSQGFQPQQMFVESKILIVEFIGTFALTYIGSWAIIYNDIAMITNTGVALATALTALVFTIFAIPISGAHFNPAITLSMVVAKRVDWTSATFYMMAQFLGAIVGAGFIFIQLNSDISKQINDLSGLGVPHPSNPKYDVSPFWGEAIGSFFIMYAYIALVADSTKNQTEKIGAAAFAFAIFFTTMTVGEISGAGLNPARSLAPAIVSGMFSKMQFVHFLGPIVGCLLSTVVYRSVYVDDEEDAKDPALKKLESDENQQILAGNANAAPEGIELTEIKK